MGVIIGAAIALLILVILSALIFRSGSAVSTGTACESIREGAECVYKEYSCPTGKVFNGGGACGEDEKCCVPFP